MRIPKPLTEKEKEFIENNWKRLTYTEMIDILKLRSRYKIQNYLSENGYVKKYKKQFSEHQKQFIRNNYLKMRESELAQILSTTRFYIQDFKRAEGLAKYENKKPSKPKEKILLCDGIFNVDTYKESWVA